MKGWEHKTTTIAIYTATFSSAAQSLDFSTMKYFSVGSAAAFFGSFFPDLDIHIFREGTSPRGLIRIKGHRGIMHYYKTYAIVYPILVIALIIARLFYNFDHMFFLIIYAVTCFFFAVMMHIAEDAPTTTGIPVRKFDDELYEAYSYKLGNYDSLTIMMLALTIIMVSSLFTAYNVFTKFL